MDKKYMYTNSSCLPKICTKIHKHVELHEKNHGQKFTNTKLHSKLILKVENINFILNNFKLNNNQINNRGKIKIKM